METSPYHELHLIDRNLTIETSGFSSLMKNEAIPMMRCGLRLVFPEFCSGPFTAGSSGSAIISSKTRPAARPSPIKACFDGSPETEFDESL